MNFPNKEIVERLRKEYPEGCRVELIHMDDPYNFTLHPGCRGTVKCVDDCGSVHISWDCGSSLAVVYGEDKCRKLDSVTTSCYGKRKHWDERADAVKHFYEGMLCAEGSERERYTNIYQQLLSGCKECIDEITE